MELVRYKSWHQPSAREGLGADVRRFRLVAISALLLMWVLLLLYRLYWLQIETGERWKQEATTQQRSFMRVSSERGPILDRHARALAVSVPAGSVYLRPRSVRDREAVLGALEAHLEIPRLRGEELLSRSAPFVWVKRQIPRVITSQIEAAQIHGLGVTLEARRFYPYGPAATPVLGMVGIDGNGLTGLEARFDGLLSAPEVQTSVFRDALGKRISADAQTLEIPRGDSLVLTIDADFQLILDEELARAARARDAKGAFGVLINGNTGEVLAVGQSPSRNLNVQGIVARSDLSSLAVETVFEPGSILKPIIAAGLLEAGVIHPAEKLDCQNGRLQIGRHSIRDVKPVSVVSFHDVVVRSSNIGMALAANRLGKQGLHHILTGFRFDETSGLGLPGESRGILRAPHTWAEIDIATHAFGQGVAVNPLQLARAFTVFTNDGLMSDLTLVTGDGVFSPHRVLSSATAAAVRAMLVDIVTAEHGTGKRAAVPGVLVGGKTGTAQKAKENGRGYQPGAYITSFIGFADTAPLGLSENFVLLISVDEPKGKNRYGGVIAAPAFQRVISRIVDHMQVDPRFRTAPHLGGGSIEDLRLVSTDPLPPRRVL